jgi:hypothetical protein
VIARELSVAERTMKVNYSQMMLITMKMFPVLTMLTVRSAAEVGAQVVQPRNPPKKE